MGRQDAHEHVRQLAVYAHEAGRSLKEVAVDDPVVRKHLTARELPKVLDPPPPGAGRSLKEVAVDAPVVRKHLTARELEKVLDPSGHVGEAPRVVSELVK